MPFATLARAALEALALATALAGLAAAALIAGA